ncbi:MAG: hypothetical protein WCK58_09790 [Chloroflexota bacterium]
MRNQLAAAGALIGLAVLLAACSGGGTAAVAGVTATSAPATAAPSSAGGGYGHGTTSAVTAAVANSSLGDIVVDGAGKTLYLFTPDGTGAPTCYDKCAANWPALVAAGTPTVGDGLDTADFGTAARTDGTTQVTFYGHPLYYFAGDQAPGDLKGQGLGGKWYVLDAKGNMVGAATASAAPSAAPPAAAGPSLAIGDTGLGKVLVDAKGMTLYMFMPDANGKSACTGDCLANWPALAGGGAPTLGTGLDAEDFATITRDDGSAQVTFYGHPLYYFAGDKAAGDTAGQALGGKWYVLGTDGTPIK